MTDLEYDVLDELYFVTPFHQLRQTLELEDDELKNVLASLLRKGWLRCYHSESEALAEDEINFSEHYDQYFYLASKEGLLAHHGR